ncbi:hypothetical protein HBA_0768 [Sodalis endosymbiont of Henestaris halophilus]|nr:hypothetical protein HBA_0768 [Sodalis endosymbiont of Henestaris halophilus]
MSLCSGRIITTSLLIMAEGIIHYTRWGVCIAISALAKLFIKNFNTALILIV